MQFSIFEISVIPTYTLKVLNAHVKPSNALNGYQKLLARYI